MLSCPLSEKVSCQIQTSTGGGEPQREPADVRLCCFKSHTRLDFIHGSLEANYQFLPADGPSNLNDLRFCRYFSKVYLLKTHHYSSVFAAEEDQMKRFRYPYDVSLLHHINTITHLDCSEACILSDDPVGEKTQTLTVQNWCCCCWSCRAELPLPSGSVLFLQASLISDTQETLSKHWLFLSSLMLFLLPHYFAQLIQSLHMRRQHYLLFSAFSAEFMQLRKF